jgi:hypothetical protein
MDVANSIPENVIDIKPPPRVLVVSEGMKITMGVVSAFSSLTILAALVFVIFHRENPVMKLAQWPFLVWLLSCGLISSVFLFLYMPTKDWHCRCVDVFQMIPLTMMAAILVGRSWRVYVTLSGALAIGRRTSRSSLSDSKMKLWLIKILTHLAKFPFWCKDSQRDSKGGSSGGFRQTASPWETTRLIFCLSFPQIVLQIVGAVIYGNTVEVELDSTQLFGREICDEQGAWVRRAGAAISVVVFLLAVIMAWVSRELPMVSDPGTFDEGCFGWL